MDFVHKPIMLEECVEGLNIKSNGIYFDGTLGGAGHSKEILKRLKTGLLVAVDKDEEALSVATSRLSEISNNFKVVKSDFKNFNKVLDDLNIDKIDGVLLDLGVSSYQLDNEERGFSYRFDTRLDMRMDLSQDFSAFDVVNNYTESQLTKIFFDYGEEPFSKKIAKNIVISRENKPIETTGQLVDIIKQSVPEKILRTKGHPAKRIFQAIRIEVNKELDGLDKALKDMINRLNKGGRLVVITFHSLEDRIVKTVFKEFSTDCICPKGFPVCVCGHKASAKLITKKPLVASKQEQEENTRSTCAKLRIVEKIV